MVNSYIISFAISISLISIFYISFKTRWPELYFSTTDKVSLFISTNARRYFLFRLLPVILITSLVLGVFSDAFTLKNSLFLGLIIGLTHSLVTNGLALIKIIKKSNSIAQFFNKPSQILIHVISLILVSFSGLLAGYLSKTKIIMMTIPTAQGLVDNIWSSIITALFAIYLFRIYENQQISSEIIFEKSLKTIDPQIIELIESQCLQKNADPYLAKSICVVENLQRPKWFRNLERIKSFLIPKGSYGIMQVKSDKYIDDAQSIRIAIERYLKLKKVTDRDSIKQIVVSYNRSDKFTEMVCDAYYYLVPARG